MKNKYDSSADTLKHIKRVNEILHLCVKNLLDRGNLHDQSKLESPEKECFDKYTPLLKDLEYGSEEYKKCLNDMSPAVKHHQLKNRHHPEFFRNNINDMNLFDLIEMICDWKAAGERHVNKPGNLFKSIEINTDRFKIDKQLNNILINTADYLITILSMSNKESKMV
jgi:hypothetical protein